VRGGTQLESMPPLLKGWEQEITAFPPYTDVEKDAMGRCLPPLPSKPFIKASLEYNVGMQLSLFRIGTDKPVVASIIAMVDVGYGVCPQVVHCRIEEGPPHLQRKKVVLNIYDSLYVSPDFVFTESTPHFPNYVDTECFRKAVAAVQPTYFLKL
jgi:hypothetical protein